MADASDFVLECPEGSPSAPYVFNFNYLMTQPDGEKRAFSYLCKYAFRGSSAQSQKIDPGFWGTDWYEQMVEHFGENETKVIINKYGQNASSALGKFDDVPVKTPELVRPTRPGGRFGRGRG